MAFAKPQRETAWDAILGEMRKQINPHSFEVWLRSTRQERLEDGTLFVSIPNAEGERVKERFGPQIELALSRLQMRGSIQRVEFVAPGATAAPLQKRLDFDSPLGSLNPRYRFNTFVVGGANQFAHAAAQAVAERPGKAYNPLFLYGGVGIGKTHLMQAIGHQVHEQRPQLKVEYITAERFTNEMITALRTERMITFRERYRTIDLLLIDDIQFIANKERTQEEFFHTFNALHGVEKQIVVSSDRPPRELVQLEDRLRSRFEWGLIADLQPPDLETRIAILMQKAQLERQTAGAPELPGEVAEYIAGRIKSNVRELEGALVRLLAYCSLKGLPVNPAVAQEALRAVFDQQQRKVDIEIIAKAVADTFGMRVPDLKARNNSRPVVFPRQIAMYLSKQLTSASLPEIARYFGGKHHSTVIHSVRKIEAERQASADLRRTLEKLMEQLQG